MIKLMLGCTKLVRGGGSTVVEYSTTDPEIKGLSPAAGQH